MAVPSLTACLRLVAGVTSFQRRCSARPAPARGPTADQALDVVTLRLACGPRSPCRPPTPGKRPHRSTLLITVADPASATPQLDRSYEAYTRGACLRVSTLETPDDTLLCCDLTLAASFPCPRNVRGATSNGACLAGASPNARCIQSVALGE